MIAVPTILNAEPHDYSPRATSILQSVGSVCELDRDFAHLEDGLPHIDALIVRLGYQIDAAVMSRAERLKFIATATTGLDHIDLDEAKDRGISVLSLRGEVDFLRSIPATAEHTWGLLLALVRNLAPAFDSVRQGEWDRDRFRGHDLCGQTLGIIGLGRIGQRVAKYAAAFGMRCVAHDPYVTAATDGTCLVPTVNEVLSQSDVVSIHVPLNAETIHLIGEAEFRDMKCGAFLVNTARGAVVDNRSMLKRLESGALAGAAIDVVEDERSDDRLIATELFEYARKHRNLLITPHIGGATYESMESTEIFMARKLASALQRSATVHNESDG